MGRGRDVDASVRVDKFSTLVTVTEAWGLDEINISYRHHAQEELPYLLSPMVDPVIFLIADLLGVEAR